MKIIGIGFFVMLCIGTVACASGLQDALTQELRNVSGLEEPGFVLSVVENDAVIAKVSRGLANLEHKAAISENTVFHIASLSKQITAAALARAVLAGKVNLDDSVADWLPEAKHFGPALTVAHLVYMTSGLTEYYELQRQSNAPWSTFHYFDIDDAINASLAVEKLQFEPGRRWQYSNINYMLIAKIVERAMAMPFAEFVHQTIFAPLGMQTARVNIDPTAVIPNRANGYRDRTSKTKRELRKHHRVSPNSKGRFVQIRRNAPHYGGSGVMASSRDWQKWVADLHSQKVLGAAFWQLMMRTQCFAHDKCNDAFGLVHSDHNGRQILWYAGGDIDTSSYSLTFTDAKISIFCFANDLRLNCGDLVTIATDVMEDLELL